MYLLRLPFRTATHCRNIGQNEIQNGDPVMHIVHKKTVVSSKHNSDGERAEGSGRPTDVAALISARAYQLYTERGGEAGHALEDWLRAENEVMRQRINSLGM